MKKQPPHEMSICRRCGGKPMMKWANDYINQITWHKVRCPQCGTQTEPHTTIWQAYEDWEDMQC